MLSAHLSQLCSMSLCQSVKPEGTLWVNQRQSSANTPSRRGPAKGAKASRERERERESKRERRDVGRRNLDSQDGSESKKMKKEN